MLDLNGEIPLPPNEPVLGYLPGSPERISLRRAVDTAHTEVVEIPHWIGGKPLHKGARREVRAPHDHQRVLGTFGEGGREMTRLAIDAALRAAPEWAAMRLEERARVFLRAADLLAGPWRARLNAATMAGQSKTVFQAEIDSACELIDFLRMNAHFASAAMDTPLLSPPGMRNVMELRPLEGFVLAVTPFNFTAIAGNLPAAPALMGNVVVWKPAEAQSLAAFRITQLFEEAGLPPGVINVVYGDGAPVAAECLDSAHLAGIHFTGSTAIFRSLWKGVADRISSYRAFPRLVGETGGKDFVFAHPSADVDSLAVALVRGAFEYQGQKCSAASRAYIPSSLWPQVRDRLVAEIERIKIGDVRDFSTFMGAVIHERSWERLASWRERAKSDPSCRVISDPGWSREVGWFAGPTLIEVKDPTHPLLQEELFGPILSTYVYDDAEVESTLSLIDRTSPYALTGAIFARDRRAIAKASSALRQAAGNLYINDKPTGAVVGQQPFGGARGSGTNDKAGSALNLLRWSSPRVIKETWAPPTSVTYPYMSERD